MRERHLVSVWNRIPLDAPVEFNRDVFRTLRLQICNIRLYKAVAAEQALELIDSEETDLHAAHFRKIGDIVAEPADTRCIQCIRSIDKTLIPIVTVMVVRKITELDGASGQNCRVGWISPERIGLVRAGAGCSKRAFEIDTGEIIFCKEWSYTRKEIIGAIFIVISRQTRCRREMHIRSERAVTGKGQRNQYVLSGLSRSPSGCWLRCRCRTHRR